MNILLTLCYHGGQYHGFQVQPNDVTVCAVLQNALEKVLGARPDIKGCSRTDAGVHALDYKANFRFETSLPDEKIPLALNSCLPPDIRVLRAQRVPEDFHARYDALAKSYRYVWLNSRIDDPFAPGQYYRVTGPMDEAAMHNAAQVLAGRHDFAAFMSAGGSITDTVRTVTAISVTREGQRVLLDITADGYLYNMVRIIAGTLLQVGRGARTAEETAAALASRSRESAGETQPACGLFLRRVNYPPERLLPPGSPI